MLSMFPHRIGATLLALLTVASGGQAATVPEAQATVAGFRDAIASAEEAQRGGDTDAVSVASILSLYNTVATNRKIIA